jgi:hypothetical protein
MGIQYFALSIPSYPLFFQCWTYVNWVHYLDIWQFVVFGYVLIMVVVPCHGKVISKLLWLSLLLSQDISLLILRKPYGYDNYLRTWVLFEMIQHVFIVIIILHKTHSKCLFSWSMRAHWITISLLTRKSWSLRIETSFHINSNQGVDIYDKTNARACTSL